jgi:hypothetical protein
MLITQSKYLTLPHDIGRRNQPMNTEIHIDDEPGYADPYVLETRQIREKLYRKNGHSLVKRLEQANKVALENGFTITRLKPAVPYSPGRVSSAVATELARVGARL